MSNPPNRPRRVSRQRYLVRRVAVICGMLALGYLVVRGVGAVLDDDGGEAIANSPAAATGPAVDPAEGSVGSTAPPVTTVPPTTVAPTTTAPERTGPPSRSEPARVLIVGDSDAGTFGPYLQTLLDGTEIVDTQLDYKVSSGLARPDFYDWPAALSAQIPELDPEIVVATFGGNDSQGLSTPGELNFIVGDPLQNEEEWTEEYTRRVGEVMDIILEGDRKLIWVGIPNDDSPEVTAKLRLQDQAAKAAAAERPEVTFIDTWTRFSGRDGNWAAFVVDPRDGQGKDVRADDGFHLNVAGAEILAIDIAQAVRDELREMGAEI